MAQNEDLAKDVFAVKVRTPQGGLRRQDVLPGADMAFEPPKKQGRKKSYASAADKDRIVSLNMLGLEPADIADQLHIGLRTVKEVIEASKTDEKAQLRAEYEAVLASDMLQKINLLLTHITTEHITTALEAGKLKDVAQSVGILSKVRGAVLQDFRERVGVDNLGSSDSLDALADQISKGFVELEKLGQRRAALDAVVIDVEVEDVTDIN